MAPVGVQQHQRVPAVHPAHHHAGRGGDHPGQLGRPHVTLLLVPHVCGRLLRLHDRYHEHPANTGAPAATVCQVLACNDTDALYAPAVPRMPQVTSPLTHNISGTAKAAVQSLLAFYIFGNETTAANVAGIALVLGGSLTYSYVRRQEMAKARAIRESEKATEAELAPIVEDPEARRRSDS